MGTLDNVIDLAAAITRRLRSLPDEAPELGRLLEKMAKLEAEFDALATSADSGQRPFLPRLQALHRRLVFISLELDHILV